MGLFRLMKKGIVVTAIASTIAYGGDYCNAKAFIDDNIIERKSGIEEIADRDSKPLFKEQYDALNSKLGEFKEGLEQLFGYK